MKAVRVSRGRRGSSVQARSAIVGVSSRWAAISAAGSSRQEARRGFRRRAGAATSGLGDAADVEAQAVLGGRPELRDRDLVLLRPVALMTLEAVAWVALAQASHEAIAGHLGHDRGGRNGRAGRVSADDPLVHGRSSAEREVAVHETKLRPLPHGAERPLEAGQVGGDRSPIRSIWLAGMETSETASAWARTACASRSRLAGARRFESFTSSRRSLPAPEASRSRSKRTPAAMIGPAQQPRAPTSSTPAIRRTPRARSWARRAESLTECAYSSPPRIRRCGRNIESFVAPHRVA